MADDWCPSAGRKGHRWRETVKQLKRESLPICWICGHRRRRCLVLRFGQVDLVPGLLRVHGRRAEHGGGHGHVEGLVRPAVVVAMHPGTGTLVPVKEVVDAAAGLGYPATYPGSRMTEPAQAVSERDERLPALAWQAVVDGSGEIILTDELVDHLTAGALAAGEAPAHVEMCARVHADSGAALERGDFTLTVTPARAAGTLTSRPAPIATGSGLEEVYGQVPTAIKGALTAQLSFPPL